MPAALLWFAAIVVTLSAIGLLLARNWRMTIALIAAQYAGAFILILASLPPNMAAVKLVTGWMCAAILGVTRYESPAEDADERSWHEGSIFRFLAALLIVITTASLFNRILETLPGISQPIIWGAMMLGGLGLIHLGITLQPMRVVIGLLTFLSGFEVMYAAVENAVLVAALLSIINLGLALTGAYWMTSRNAPRSEL